MKLESSTFNHNLFIENIIIFGDNAQYFSLHKNFFIFSIILAFYSESAHFLIKIVSKFKKPFIVNN